MDEKDKRIAELEAELHKTNIALYRGVRNAIVLPRGLLLGKSEKEIAEMTLATIDEMNKIIDFAAVDRELAKYGKNYIGGNKA